MTLVFWLIAITMVVAAILFIAVPISRKGDNLSLAIAIVIAIPLSGFSLYSLIGSPGELKSGANAAHITTNQSARSQNGIGTGNSGSVASLIGGLRSRLEDNPDDAGGWLLLAQSYRHLGDDAAAYSAYQRAKALGRSDPRFELTDTGAIGNQASVAADAAVRVRGQVSLAAELADQVRPDDTVFIFAKESRNHRMPVAAIRRPAASLPIDFELTNAQAMIAGTDLAEYESLVVTARISRTGLATDSGKGWEAWSAPTSLLDDKIVKLVIAAGEQSRVKPNE